MKISVTPIRAGSKGVPHKNIRLLNGKPLFHHVVLEAQKVSSLDEVWISTESEYYASMAPPGVLVHKRSKELASDNIPTRDVIMEFLESHSYVSTIVILNATSPTTTSKDIEEALRLSASGKGCISVQPSHVQFYLENEPIWRGNKVRQEARTFASDGGICVIHAADFLKTKSCPTLPCHTMVIPHPVCDIDTEQDFEHASALLSRRDTACLDIDETYVRLKTNNRTEQWSTPTLCKSRKQLKSFILDKIKQIDEREIYISTSGIIREEEGQYLVSDASEIIPFWNGTVFPKFVAGKSIKMLNEGDSSVMELVRKNNIQQRNVLLLLFGTEIASGLYINGNVVKNTNVGQPLEPEFSTNFETSDPLQLVKELNKIKIMISLDDVYLSGSILKHKRYMDILERNGIRSFDSYK